MVRCPHCCSYATRWDESGFYLECNDCDRFVEIVREPPAMYDEYTDAGGAGKLACWIESADDALDADRAWLISEISRLDTYRYRVIGAAGRQTRCRVTLTILGECARWIWNIARARSGEADLIVRSARQRTAAFAGYRHALAESSSAGQRPALGLGSGLQLGGAQATHRLRGGMQFGRIACAPDRNHASDARGEDALIDRVDLDGALCATTIPAIDLYLLQLVDVGFVRSRARRSRRGIALAVEPLSIPDALERLRGEPGAPRTQAEARKRIKRARDAVRDALRERGLIPPRERRAAPQRPPVEPVRPMLPRVA